MINWILCVFVGATFLSQSVEGANEKFFSRRVMDPTETFSVKISKKWVYYDRTDEGSFTGDIYVNMFAGNLETYLVLTTVDVEADEGEEERALLERALTLSGIELVCIEETECGGISGLKLEGIHHEIGDSPMCVRLFAFVKEGGVFALLTTADADTLDDIGDTLKLE
jgi:hypothetical protein